MGTELWRERVVVNPKVHHGEACIKGTRVPVAMIIGCLAEGMSHPEIIGQYPQLTDEDIAAALQYAAQVVNSELLLPLGD